MGPHAAAIRAVLVVLAHGGKAHDLAQVALSFAVDCTERLPHNGAEEVAFTLFEVLVVLGMLAALGILLTGPLRQRVGVVEGARHCDIQRESSILFPQGDGHVAWSSAWSGSQYSLLLEHR